MLMTIASLLFTSSSTIYLPEGRPLPRIEAITDRGPILEMIVKCQSGTAIMTFSKIERVYCGPRGHCDRSRRAVISRLCS